MKLPGPIVEIQQSVSNPRVVICSYFEWTAGKKLSLGAACLRKSFKETAVSISGAAGSTEARFWDCVRISGNIERARSLPGGAKQSELHWILRIPADVWLRWSVKARTSFSKALKLRFLSTLETEVLKSTLVPHGLMERAKDGVLTSTLDGLVGKGLDRV